MAGMGEISGFTQCPGCIGTGQVACPDCSGWGARSCASCAGSNIATCSQCRGQRSVVMVALAPHHGLRGGVGFATRHSSRFAAGALTALAAAILLGTHIHF